VRLKSAIIAGDYGDVGLFQEGGGEGDGVGDFYAAGFFAEIGADVREAVESALRFDAGDFGEGGQALVHVGHALGEFAVHGGDGFWAARVGQGDRRGLLAEAGDVAGHLRLELVDGVDDGFRAADIAYSPAGHGEGFAVAVEGEGALDELWVERGEGDELQAVVGELFVDLVGEDRKVWVFDDDIGEGFEFFGRVGVAGGV